MLSHFKRRYLRGVLAVMPLLSGVIWGGFWVNAAGSIDDFHVDGVRLLLCFAFGVWLNSLPAVSFGKLGCWFIAGVCMLKWNCILPMAFVFGLSSGFLRRRGAGNFICGMIAGSFIGSSFRIPRELILMLIGIVQMIPCRRERRRPYPRKTIASAHIFNGAAMAVSLFFAWFIHSGLMEQKIDSSSIKIPPVTWVSAAGLSQKNIPSVLLISRNHPGFNTPVELILSGHVNVMLPGRLPKRRYDVIVIGDCSAAMRAAPGQIIEALAPGGVLVAAQKYCQLFPQLPWRTLPGNSEVQFAAAVPDSNQPLEISGEEIEKNLRNAVGEIRPEYSETILPGAISGALVDFKSVEVELPEVLPRQFDGRKFIWGIAGLLILLEILMHNSSRREYLCLVISAVIYGLSCGILAVSNGLCEIVDGSVLRYGIAVLPLWIRIPFKERALRWISILAVIALAVWYFYHDIWFAIPALLLASLTFAGCRSRFHVKTNSIFNWQDGVCFAALAGAFWLGGIMDAPVLIVIMVIGLLKFWLQIRS